MKRLFLLVSALVLLAGSAQAQVVPGAPPTDWDKEHKQYTVDVLRDYTDLMRSWTEALRRGSAKDASEFYSDDAFLFTDSSLIQGKGAIEAQLTKVMPRFAHLRIGLSDFAASDRLAYAVGPAWYEIQTVSGKTEEISGAIFTVLVREGRRWKIRSQTFR